MSDVVGRYYYCGIDIDPKSNGYKMVSRTRLVSDEPIEVSVLVKVGNKMCSNYGDTAVETTKS